MNINIIKPIYIKEYFIGGIVIFITFRKSTIKKTIFILLFFILFHIISPNFLVSATNYSKIEISNNSWELTGDYTYSNGVVQLTSANRWQLGQAWLNRSIAGTYKVSFKYKAGEGTGADGFAIIFNAEKTDTSQEAGGYIGIPYNCYALEFDSWYNWYDGLDNSPSPHIALVKDGSKTHLKTVNSPKVADNLWHTVDLFVSPDGIRADVDGQTLLEYEGKIDQRFSNLGFSAATGNYTNVHSIDLNSFNVNIEDNNRFSRYIDDSTGHSYSVLEEKLSWEEAKAYCESVGGYLATLSTSQEQESVYNYIEETANSDQYFLGATDKEIEGTWSWITGEPFDYSNWISGEPNNEDGYENFLVITNNWRNNKGTWNDEDSKLKLGFICEWDSTNFTSNGNKIIAQNIISGKSQNKNTIGNLSISSDSFEALSDGKSTAKGNISINDFLKINGKVVVNWATLEINCSGTMYIPCKSSYLNGEIPIYTGDFTINANTLNISKNTGIDNLKISGFDFEITKLDIGKDKLDIGGTIKLHEKLGGAKVNISSLSVSNLGVELNAKITLPKITIPSSNLTLENVYMQLNTNKNIFEGGGTLCIPKLPNFSASIGFQNAKLDKIFFSIDEGLNIAIGSSGLFLQGLGGGVSGLAAPPISITAQTAISAGPKIGDYYTFLGKDLRITISLDGKISGSGTLQLLSKFDLTKATFEVNKFQSLALTTEFNALDIIKANIDFKVDSTSFSGKASAKIAVPKDIKFIGGIGCQGDISIDNAGVKGNAKYGPIKFGVSWSFDDDFPTFDIGFNSKSILNSVTYLSDLKSKSYISQNQFNLSLKTFTIPSNTDQIVIHIKSAGNNSNFTLISPNGEIIAKTSDNYFVDESTFGGNFYALNNPLEGEWSYYLDDSSQTDYTLEVQSITPPPNFDIKIENSVANNNYIDINWASSSTTGLVNLYFDDLSRNIKNIQIAKNIDLKANNYTIDTSKFSSGDYRLYATLSYDKYLTFADCENNSITLNNPSAPTAPLIKDVSSGDRKINISIDESTDSNLSYNIYYKSSTDSIKTINVPLGNPLIIDDFSDSDFDKEYSIWVTSEKDGIESILSNTYNYYLPKPTPPKVSILWPKFESTASNQIELTGSVDSKSNISIYCNEKEIYTEYTQSFSSYIPITSGENIITVVTKNSVGDKYIEEKTIYKDTTPPQLTLNNMEKELFVTSSTFEITGMTEYLATVYINDTEISKTDDGFFSYSLPITDGKNFITIKSVDQSGNETVFYGTIYNNTCEILSSYPNTDFDYMQYDNDIIISFSSELNEDTSIGNILLSDEYGNAISTSSYISKNKLVIKHPPLNLGKKYTLVISENTVFTKDLKTLSKPYILNFKTSNSDLDYDKSSTLDIIDISILAMSYGLNTDSENFDNLYDINSDGVIDLFDIIILAKQL